MKRIAKLVWNIRHDILSRPPQIGKLSFFVHNFMDASALDRARCEACSFMVMTPDGPLSMCVHNAKRDAYLLQPAQVLRGKKIMFFNPVNGRLQDEMPRRLAVQLTHKNARGRAKSPPTHSHAARAAESSCA